MSVHIHRKESIIVQKSHEKKIKHKYLELPPFLSIFANHNKVMRTK